MGWAVLRPARFAVLQLDKQRYNAHVAQLESQHPRRLPAPCTWTASLLQPSRWPIRAERSHLCSYCCWLLLHHGISQHPHPIWHGCQLRPVLQRRGGRYLRRDCVALRYQLYNVPGVEPGDQQWVHQPLAQLCRLRGPRHARTAVDGRDLRTGLESCDLHRHKLWEMLFDQWILWFIGRFLQRWELRVWGMQRHLDWCDDGWHLWPCEWRHDV